MGLRFDKRNIAYKVDGAGIDPWPILGTFLLVVFLFAFALIVWQGRQASRPTSHKTPTDRIVLVASPQPTNLSTPSPEATATPPAPAAQPQLVDTGASQPNAPAVPSTKPTSRPTAKPTPAPKPTVTHQPPTVILKAIPGGSKGAEVTADASFSWDATGIVSYQFNWGDGIAPGPQSSPVATHLYNGPGTYLITVIAVNSVGLASSDSKYVTVG